MGGGGRGVSEREGSEQIDGPGDWGSPEKSMVGTFLSDQVRLDNRSSNLRRKFHCGGRMVHPKRISYSR